MTLEEARKILHSAQNQGDMTPLEMALYVILRDVQYRVYKDAGLIQDGPGCGDPGDEPPNRRMMGTGCKQHPSCDLHEGEYDEIPKSDRYNSCVVHGCQPVTAPGPADAPKQDAPRGFPKVYIVSVVGQKDERHGCKSVSDAYVKFETVGGCAMSVRTLPTAKELGETAAQASIKSFNYRLSVDYVEYVGAAIYRALGVSK